MAIKYISSSASGTDDGTSPTHTSGTVGPWTLAQMIAATPAAGDELRIMTDGVYTRAATGSITYANGTNTANIVITGANSSGVVDGTRPTIQASAASITLFSSTANHIRFNNLILDGNNQTGVTGISYIPTYGRISRIKAINCTTTGISIAGGNSVWGERLEAYGCATGVNIAGTCGCYFVAARNNTGTGIVFTGAAASINRWVCYNNAIGVSLTSVGYQAQDGVAYANSGAGVNLTGNAGFGTFLTGVISYGNTGDGFATDGVQSGATLFRCAGGGNGGVHGNYNSAQLPNVEDFVTVSGNPYNTSLITALTSTSTLDDVFAAFSPISTGGGASVRGAGYPAYLDIGSTQHQDSGGGGGTAITDYVVSF